MQLRGNLIRLLIKNIRVDFLSTLKRSAEWGYNRISRKKSTYWSDRNKQHNSLQVCQWLLQSSRHSKSNLGPEGGAESSLSLSVTHAHPSHSSSAKIREMNSKLSALNSAFPRISPLGAKAIPLGGQSATVSCFDKSLQMDSTLNQTGLHVRPSASPLHASFHLSLTTISSYLPSPHLPVSS